MTETCRIRPCFHNFPTVLLLKREHNVNLIMDQIKNKSPFLEEVRKVLRVQHYAIRTEQSYVEWIKRFILFHNKRHPNEMGESEVAGFLTHLSVNRNVAPATQG
jgi:hypothetical protein